MTIDNECFELLVKQHGSLIDTVGHMQKPRGRSGIKADFAAEVLTLDGGTLYLQRRHLHDRIGS